MRRDTQLLLQELNATVTKIIYTIFIKKTAERRITCNMRRSYISHHIFCTFKGSSLYILSVIIEHFIGKMTARQELTDSEFWNKAIYK